MSMYLIRRLESKTGNFVINISKEYQDMTGQTLYAAVIMERVRSMFQPVLQGIAITQNEIDGYMAK